MNRRSFIQASLALSGATAFLSSCKTKKEIKGEIIGASSNIGHMLRNGGSGQPESFAEKSVVIIGGGVSGLSAARKLLKRGFDDFVVLDLEAHAGGNAASGRNSISAFPWGAHYVPTPNNNLTDYLDFLKECNVITSFDPNGLPVYNEYYLCFDPQERLYINGRWQDGLVPQFSVPVNEQNEIARFFHQMEVYRNQKGSDGKDAFAIPIDESSKDEVFVALDRITMKEWMAQQGYKSSYLHWYINYSTRDDFGTTYDRISAWTGIHYYAARKGKGVNAAHQDVLTWPEGNGFLVGQLQKDFAGHILTHALATEVRTEGEKIAITYYDVQSKTWKGFLADQCILAVPQFVAARLLHDEDRLNKVHQHLHYAPWMVANMIVNELQERSGVALSWDNVLYDSPSLGYVDASHQFVQQKIKKRNLTYYYPLTDAVPEEARKAAQVRSHKDWVEMIIKDLKKVHPNIEDVLEEVNVMVWGHAMAQPLPGIAHGTIRKELSASIANRIHFAHTDLAGISIFEEAFYQGLGAAEKVMAQIKRKA